MTNGALMVRALGRFRNVLAEVMADEGQAGRVRSVAKSLGIDLYATGELRNIRERGAVVYGHAEFSCRQLEQLEALAGSLRVDPPAVCPKNPWE